MPQQKKKYPTNKRPGNRPKDNRQPIVQKKIVVEPKDRILTYYPDMNVAMVAEGLGLSNAAMIKKINGFRFNDISESSH